MSYNSNPGNLDAHLVGCKEALKKPVECTQGCGLHVLPPQLKAHNCIMSLRELVNSQRELANSHEDIIKTLEENCEKLEEEVRSKDELLNSQAVKIDKLKKIFEQADNVLNGTSKGSETHISEMKRVITTESTSSASTSSAEHGDSPSKRQKLNITTSTEGGSLRAPIDGGDGKFYCPVCSKSFPNCHVASTHIQEEHTEVPRHLWKPCPMCNQHYKTQRMLMVHLRAVHNISAIPVNQ